MDPVLRQPTYTGSVLENAFVNTRPANTGYGVVEQQYKVPTTPAQQGWNSGMTFFNGFGWYDPKTSQYFQDENQYNDWKQRDALRTQNNNINDANLLSQWGAPAGTNVWDAAGQVSKANTLGGSTSWGYTPTPTVDPTTTTKKAATTSVSVPTNNNNNNNGFLPDYHRTAQNPWTGQTVDNNPNLNWNPGNQVQFGSGQIPGQMSYLMGKT